MHKKLSKVDPKSALRINQNDTQRIQRALEVLEITGNTLTELTNTKNKKSSAKNFRNKFKNFGNNLLLNNGNK